MTLKSLLRFTMSWLRSRNSMKIKTPELLDDRLVVEEVIQGDNTDIFEPIRLAYFN